VKRLAETAENLYQNSSLWAQLGRKTKTCLFLEYIKMCPQDSSARQALLEVELEQFRYCQHEWPAGILYGHDGATIDQCQDLLAAVDTFRQLDIEKKYTQFIEEFQKKVECYKERLDRESRSSTISDIKDSPDRDDQSQSKR